jgi:hypothetical protein
LVADRTHARVVENITFPTILMQVLKRIINYHQQTTFLAASHSAHVANSETAADFFVGQHVTW